MISQIDNGPFAPCPAPFNMAAHVLGKADANADKIALSILGDAPEDWTYGKLQAAVRGIATGLLERGLVAGDRVLLRLGNSVDFPLAYLGAIAVGLVPIPTSAALTMPEVRAIIAQTTPKAVIRDPSVACPDHALMLTPDDLHAMRDLPAAPWHMGDPDRAGYIVFTSGTSGQPRAVVHAHRAIWARRMMFEGWYGLSAQDRICHAGSFNWTYTLGTGLMDPWTAGATALIPAASTSADALPALLADHRASIFAAAPGVYRQMLKEQQMVNLPALRHGLSAGEKLGEGVRQQWQAATGTPILEAYGLSECSTFLSACPAAPDHLRAQNGRHVALIGPDGPVARGDLGTIAVHRSDQGLMLGYLGAEAETAARYQGEWFLTGDEAVMDARGNITYLGRDDDMMNAGGYRVSPIEVEQAMAGFDGITAIAAVEVRIKADTTIIGAFYTARAPLDEDALHRYAKENLARYKAPRFFRRLPALPTGANGKLQRGILRAEFEASHDRPDSADRQA